MDGRSTQLADHTDSMAMVVSNGSQQSLMEVDGDQQPSRSSSRAPSIFSESSVASSISENGHNLTGSVSRIFDNGPDRLLKVFATKGIHDLSLQPESIPNFWKTQICEMMTSSPALQNIVYGISADRLLALTGDESYLSDRLGYLGQALTHLQDALYDPAKQLEDATFVTMFLLGIFGLLTDRNATNWTKHFRGITALMKKRGVKSFEAFPQRVFFYFIRSYEIHRALAVEEPTFLAEPAWRKLNEKRGEFSMHLSDIMARVSQVCYGPTSAFGFEGEIQRLREASQLRDELLEWWLDPQTLKNYPETISPQPTVYISNIRNGEEIPTYPFSHRISHATFTGNLACSNYRATVLHLHHHFFPKAGPDAYLSTLAQELCMSVDSAVRHGNLFSQLWYLEKASFYLNGDERRWVAKFLDQLGDDQGLPIAHSVAYEIRALFQEHFE